jgi:hypothetical protein
MISGLSGLRLVLRRLQSPLRESATAQYNLMTVFLFLHHSRWKLVHCASVYHDIMAIFSHVYHPDKFMSPVDSPIIGVSLGWLRLF